MNGGCSTTPTIESTPVSANSASARARVSSCRTGEVAWSSITDSGRPRSAVTCSIAWRTTGSVGVVSWASSSGRSHGTRAPAARATSAISSSSVETTTSRSGDSQRVLDRPHDQRLAADVEEVLAGDALRASAGRDHAQRHEAAAVHELGDPPWRAPARIAPAQVWGRLRDGACRNAPRTRRSHAGGRGEVDPRVATARRRLEHSGGEDADDRAGELVQGRGGVDLDPQPGVGGMGETRGHVALGRVRPIDRMVPAGERQRCPGQPAP